MRTADLRCIAKVVSSGAIIPALAPPSIDMLQIVMRPAIESERIVLPRYSITWPVAPPVPIRAMMPRMMSLAVTPDGKVAVDVDRHRLGAILGKGLSGEDVLDLGGADPEGEGTKGTVGRGVRVAADDQHPWLGDALLGPDDVDDAGTGIVEAEEGDAELLAVSNQCLDLNLRHRIGDPQMAVGGWHAVIDRGERQIGSAHRTAVQPQANRRPGGRSPRGRDGGRRRAGRVPLPRSEPDAGSRPSRRVSAAPSRCKVTGRAVMANTAGGPPTTVSPSSVRIIGTSPGTIP